MVSQKHEMLHGFLRDHPEAIAGAFTMAGLASVPPAKSVEIHSGDATECKPLERRVDTVILYNAVDGSSFIMLLESQSAPDAKKRLSWPYYVAYMHERHKCPVVLVVLCHKSATAEWASQPIVVETDFWCTSVLWPAVLGPHNVPQVTAALENGLLAGVLSVIVRSTEVDQEQLKHLAVKLKQTDEKTQAELSICVVTALGSLPTAEIWSTMMSMDMETLRSTPVLNRILAENDQKKLAEGEAKGKAEGKAEAILSILDHRSVPLIDRDRERILSCTDLAQLDAWFNAALDATSAAELFQ